MCGRFVQARERAELAAWFEAQAVARESVVPTWNAAPQSRQAVVRQRPGRGGRELALLRWGLVPAWALDARIGLMSFNARSETAAAKPAFGEALKRRRCLVPADAYYEWKTEGGKGKQAYAIGLASGEPMALAGLWESWQEPAGGVLESFSILTTEANERLRELHARMPVIVERNEYSRWLEGVVPEELMRPLAAGKVKVWPVGARVGNVRNDDAGLVARVEERGRQGELF